MRSIFSMLAACAALATSSASSAATFAYDYLLSRDGETLTGIGTFTTEDGVQQDGGTFYDVVGATGDVTYRFEQDSRTANVSAVFGVTGTPIVGFLDSGDLVVKLGLNFDEQPHLIIFDTDRPNAFVTEALFRVDSFNLTPLAQGVPEPASWALMIGGFGLAGFQMRRKRPVATLA